MGASDHSGREAGTFSEMGYDGVSQELLFAMVCSTP